MQVKVVVAITNPVCFLSESSWAGRKKNKIHKSILFKNEDIKESLIIKRQGRFQNQITDDASEISEGASCTSILTDIFFPLL